MPGWVELLFATGGVDRGGGALRSRGSIAYLVLAALLAAICVAQAATPPQGALSANDQGQGNTVTWTGTVHPGSETGAQDQGVGCFDPTTSKPADPTTTGCDIFTLDVNVSASFYQHFIGGPQVKI